MARASAAAETETPTDSPAPTTLRFLNYLTETVYFYTPDDTLNLKRLLPGETIALDEKVAALFPNFLAPATEA